MSHRADGQASGHGASGGDTRSGDPRAAEPPSRDLAGGSAPSGRLPVDLRRDAEPPTGRLAGVEPPSGAALAPVRARYASWLGLDRAHVLSDREEDPAQVRALQLILRLERTSAPDWYAALELAAQGCAALCLDQRAEPGGPWFDAIHDYCAGHIRKVTRRARASHWDATAGLPGVTLTRDDTQVRALLPGLVGELDKRVSKLQVGGTDAPRHEPDSWPDPVDGALIVHPAPTVRMTLGKTMAQAGHAGMIGAALLAGDDRDALHRWHAAGLPVAARPASEQQWRAMTEALRDPSAAWRRQRLVAVRDAGFTEIDPGTITVIAVAPG